MSSQCTVECKRNVCGYQKTDKASKMSVEDGFLYMWKLQLTVSRLVWFRRSNVHVSVAYCKKEILKNPRRRYVKLGSLRDAAPNQVSPPHRH